MSSEQDSCVENGAAKGMPTVERVVRLLYATLAKLPPAESEEAAKTKGTAELNQAERIAACRDEKHGWGLPAGGVAQASLRLDADVLAWLKKDGAGVSDADEPDAPGTGAKGFGGAVGVGGDRLAAPFPSSFWGAHE